jgi:parallel beta-helix repeat protein
LLLSGCAFFGAGPHPGSRNPASGGGSILVPAGDHFAARLQETLITAPPGSIVELPAGTFHFDDEISIGKPFLTLRGQGKGKTILDFAGQTAGKQGIFATSDGVTLEDFTVLDTDGNGVKVTGSNGVVIRRIAMKWTRGPNTENGGYAIYPVSTENLLIEDCEVSGASDSGIYVGQSKNVIVRNNLATGNVAGIEIENTQNAEVYDNEATGNTAGILAFDLPNLNLRQGGHIRVYRNNVHGNNLRNFAPKGNIVGSVAKGIGMLILATKHVEIFENTLSENHFADFVVANYLITSIPVPGDGKYDPTPVGIYIHDNLTSEYRKPQINLKNKISLVANWLFHFDIPDILYDGIRDGTYAGKRFEGEDRICFARNHNAKGRLARFGNMHLDSGRKQFAFPGGPATRDASTHDCELTPLAESKVVPPVFDPERYPNPVLGETSACETIPAKGVNLAAALGADCAKLSAYGLFENPRDPRVGARGAGFPYDLTSPLFSDYARKARFIFIPPGEKAQYRKTGILDFPVGSIIAKTFWFKTGDAGASASRLVETRLLIHRSTGWVGLPYVWNADQTEAFLTRGGATVELPYAWVGKKPPSKRVTRFPYHVPNANQCVGCHSSSGAVTPIGPKVKLLNRETVAELGGGGNQISEMIRRGILTGVPEEDPARLPKLADYRDATLPAATRAHAYLEINCAHCHTPNGNAGMSGLWMESERDPASPNAGICKHPVAAGTATAKLKYDILPGNPENSILIRRISTTRPANKMPELGRNLVHDEGVALISAWIKGLPGNCRGK